MGYRSHGRKNRRAEGVAGVLSVRGRCHARGMDVLRVQRSGFTLSLRMRVISLARNHNLNVERLEAPDAAVILLLKGEC